MRMSAVMASDPVTTFVTLEADPDTLGCTVYFQQVTEDGTVDGWHRDYPRLDEALAEIERDLGIGPKDWVPIEP